MSSSRRSPSPISEERSRLMSSIRSINNQSTEQALVSILRANGITGWRRRSRLFGKPDFVFASKKVAVFVDGCFWHGCPRCYLAPKHNSGYWADKVTRNRARDLRVSRELRASGWSVLRIWEHSLSKPASVAKRIRGMLNRPGASNSAIVRVR